MDKGPRKWPLWPIVIVLLSLFLVGAGGATWSYFLYPRAHPAPGEVHGGIELVRHGSLHLAAISLEIFLGYFFVHAWWENDRATRLRLANAKAREDLKTALGEFLSMNVARLFFCMLDDLEVNLGGAAARKQLTDRHRAKATIEPETCAIVCGIYRDNRTTRVGYKPLMEYVADVLAHNTALFERLGPEALSIVYRTTNSIQLLFEVPLIPDRRFEKETCERFLAVYQNLLDLFGQVIHE